MAFSGWPEEALDFYEGLAADNTKAYWTANQAVYTGKILGPMTELTEELAAEFGEPKIFRPYRDIRFSKDKTPYKTHIGATVGDSCYVQLSVEGLGAGAGMWEMNPEQLARYREAVADDKPGAELEQIVAEIEKADITVPGWMVPRPRTASSHSSERPGLSAPGSGLTSGCEVARPGQPAACSCGDSIPPGSAAAWTAPRRGRSLTG